MWTEATISNSKQSLMQQKRQPSLWYLSNSCNAPRNKEMRRRLVVKSTDRSKYLDAADVMSLKC
jgi:hypothetical protein